MRPDKGTLFCRVIYISDYIGYFVRSEAISRQKQKKEPVNIIFMRKLGRIYSAKVSGRLLLVAVLFLTGFTGFSIWAINQAATLYFENRRMASELVTVKKQLEEYQFKSQVLTQYHQLVDELNKADRTLEENSVPEEVKAGLPAGETPQETAGGPASAPGETGTPPVEAQNENVLIAESPSAPADPPVDAIQLSLNPGEDNSAVTFRFNLRNVAPGSKAVSGYLFLILTNITDEGAAPAVYPEVELVDGQPADFRKGTQFSIRHRKFVQGKVDNLKNAENYKQAWVFAYSEDGELLLKKEISNTNG